MSNDPHSPFNWRMRTEPSIFAKDVHFRPRKEGKSNGEVQSDVIERKREQGELPGHIEGLGKSNKSKTERLLAYKHFGTYTRAAPSIKHPNKHEEGNAPAKTTRTPKAP